MTSNAEPRRRSGWFMAALALAAFAVLVGLGTWQMARRAEKHALIATMESRLAEPAATLPARIEDPDAWDYRRVHVTGVFRHDREVHLANRVRNGVVGVQVVTPLARPDGATVLVDRGWVPGTLADPARRPDGQVGGMVTVAGIARVPAPPGPFTPAGDPATGFWLVAEPAAIAAALGLAETLPLVLEADATPNPGGWPRGGGTRLDLPDNHLQYAITWYSLAVALVVIALIARRRRSGPVPHTDQHP